MSRTDTDTLCEFFRGSGFQVLPDPAAGPGHWKVNLLVGAMSYHVGSIDPSPTYTPRIHDAEAASVMRRWGAGQKARAICDAMDEIAASEVVRAGLGKVAESDGFRADMTQVVPREFVPTAADPAQTDRLPREDGGSYMARYYAEQQARRRR